MEIITPLNTIYYNATQFLQINAVDNREIDMIWFNWDGTNVTYTSGQYITFNEGLNTIHAWANDSAGNVGSNSVTFEYFKSNFASIWNTSKLSYGLSADNQIKLPLDSHGSYNFIVDWGDGTNDTITKYDQPEVTHTYASQGVYSINISGLIDGWRFNNGGDKLKLLEIKQWSNLRLGNSYGYFYGCSNLVITATDILDLTGTSSLNSAFSDCTNIDTVYNMNEWDVSSVRNMGSMFRGASLFNQSIGNWNVSRVTDMGSMFSGASSFNQNIGNWDVSSVTHIYDMFSDAHCFNQDIGNWDVSSVIYMNKMFSGASIFNQDISNWDVSSVIYMNKMFSGASIFNQDISNWDESRVTNMYLMFCSAHCFNQDISNWDVSSVTRMDNMFNYAYIFNQDISNWDVSSVTNMGSMFSYASIFNQDISNWDVSSVTDMYLMFNSAHCFNQDIGSWNVSSVIDMGGMFSSAYCFNQDIGSWNVSSVIDMGGMFNHASLFNQDIGSWNVSSVIDMGNMFSYITLSITNYDSLLIGWSQLTLQDAVSFHGGYSQYSAGTAATARQNIIDNFGWSITDNGQQT